MAHTYRPAATSSIAITTPAAIFQRLTDAKRTCAAEASSEDRERMVMRDRLEIGIVPSIRTSALRQESVPPAGPPDLWLLIGVMLRGEPACI